MTDINHYRLGLADMTLRFLIEEKRAQTLQDENDELKQRVADLESGVVQVNWIENDMRERGEAVTEEAVRDRLESLKKPPKMPPMPSDRVKTERAG